MKMLAIVFAILMSMTPHKSDTETREEREVRMGQFTAAIAIASEGDRERAIYLLVQLENETHAAQRTQRHECKPWECDPITVVVRGKKQTTFRARGPWQVQEGYQPHHRALWAQAGGHDFAGLVAGAKLADDYRSTCGGDLVAQYSANDGKGCTLENGLNRATESGKLRAERHEQLRRKWGAEAWRLDRASD